MTKSELLDKLAEGLAHREYSLLLGAGASVGAHGGNGLLLPTGTGLRDALVQDFKIDTGRETVTLAQAYDYIYRRQRDKLCAYLRHWFTNCEPSWQHLLAEFGWNHIWTFNIDDVIEAAFRKGAHPLRSCTWNERLFDQRAPQVQQIIHLHGAADRLVEGADNDQVLVFSILEYVRTVAVPRAWHMVFYGEFAERPFVVIGARLTEEFDLAEILDSGSTAEKVTGYPSVVVVPSITAFRREELEAAGLVIIEREGEGFVRDLLDRYRGVIGGLDEVYGAITPAVARFLQQFIDLRRYHPTRVPSEDFYSGYQPSWNTIQGDDDAVLDITTRASEHIVNASMKEQVLQEVYLLSGDPGGGKSTSLLRIAKNLIGAGARPFLFRADEAIDVEATVGWLKLVPRTVLLFDDCAEFSSAIQQLAERSTTEGVRMVSIVADRSARLGLIRDRIASNYLRPDPPYWCGRLSDSDVESIIDKLHSRGRLGKITRLTREQQRAYFAQTATRRLFDAMAELEEGSGFKQKVQSIYRGLATDQLRSLYAAACLCYELGIPLPTGIGVKISGIAPKDLTTVIEREGRGVLVLTRPGIRPPHRVTASMVVNDVLSRSVRFDITLSLAKALAPHIDQQAMSAETRHYRILRQLMDQETVTRHVGQQRARDWYDNLRELYDWNGRYWDQRALLESELGEHATARSYAERSIQVHPHPFAYNTLGTVLLRMAIRTGSEDTLVQGIRNLERARGFQHWGTREHPFVTFFSSLIRFAELWGINAVPHRVRSAWTVWLRDANSSPVYSHPQRRGELDGWQHTWLGFAVAPKADSSDNR